jgi:predicted solute-binding protein
VSKLRISVVQYLNTAPLVWGFTNGPLQGKYDLSFTVPSQCAEDLRASRADVAIIPAIEYQRIPGLAILPDMAIASKNHVRSLLLVAKKPIEQVKTFALDSSSRSTQALTRILCSEKWRIAPQFAEALPDLPEMLHNADAALLIGDPALRISLAIEKDSWPGAPGQTGRDSSQTADSTDHKNTTFPRTPPSTFQPSTFKLFGESPVICQAATLGITSSELLYVYDVVAEWRALAGLPAVLAIWAVRRELAIAELTADFLASRDFGLSHLGEISYEASQDLELPQRALESYLRDNIDFSLDPENRRGLELYFEHAARLGLIAKADAIHWAAAKSEAVKL